MGWKCFYSMLASSQIWGTEEEYSEVSQLLEDISSYQRDFAAMREEKINELKKKKMTARKAKGQDKLPCKVYQVSFCMCWYAPTSLSMLTHLVSH